MSAREVLLAEARKHVWAAWQLSAEELASQAVATLHGLGMLVPEGGAQELEKLRSALRDATDQIARLESDLGGATARVAELEAKQKRTVAHTQHLAETLVARTVDLMAVEADAITARIAPTQALREECAGCAAYGECLGGGCPNQPAPDGAS